MPRATCQILHHPHPRDGMPPAIPDHRLPLTISLVARKASGHAQNTRTFKGDPTQTPQARISGRWHTVHHGQIAAVDRVFLKLRGQPMMRAIRFRHHQKARRILVNPVHNAGAARPPHA